MASCLCNSRGSSTDSLRDASAERHDFLNAPQLSPELGPGRLRFCPDELPNVVQTLSEVVQTLIESRVRIADPGVRLEPRQNDRYESGK
jgi:hypothetical protein